MLCERMCRKIAKHEYTVRQRRETDGDGWRIMNDRYTYGREWPLFSLGTGTHILTETGIS
jgi:hypothetical protein